MAGQKVIGADAAEIDTPVIVAIAVVKSKGVVVREGAGAKGVVYGLFHGHGDAVNPHLQGDDAAPRHIRQTPIRAYTGAGDAEQRRVLAGRLRLA